MRASSVLKELLTEYQGKIRVVLKHMVVHPQTVATAHKVSCAAAKQGKFAEFSAAFWEKGFGPYMKSQGQDSSAMSESNTWEIAKAVGVDVDKAKGDLADCEKVVANDEAELKKWGVSGTPAFFINGEFVGGGIPKEAFKEIIDRKLKTFSESGVPAEQYYDKVILGTGDKTLRTKPLPNPPKC